MEGKAGEALQKKGRLKRGAVGQNEDHLSIRNGKGKKEEEEEEGVKAKRSFSSPHTFLCLSLPSSNAGCQFGFS